MIDLTTYTDDDLDALLVAVLTERERRQRIATAPALVESLTEQYEAATADAPVIPWADLADRVGPGQRIVWTDGNTYRNTSRAWLNINDTPETYPQGYAQETGLPPDVASWETGGTYRADDLRTFGGIVYRCIQPHTNYDPGHTPNLTPSLWTPQG